jgi:hypothetical protein
MARQIGRATSIAAGQRKELTGGFATDSPNGSNRCARPKPPGPVPGETCGNRGLAGKAVVFGSI